MKIKAICGGLVFLLFLSCVSTQVFKERTRYFDKFSIDEIWQASLNALEELEYVIRVQEKWRGFLYAEREKHQFSTLRLPLQLSVHISEEEGQIKVDCEAILIGKKMDYPTERRRTVSIFLKTLREHLKKQIF